MDFSWDRGNGLDDIQVPARCVDVELAEPLDEIVEPGYASVQLFIRLNGQPVGVIALPLVDGRCSTETVGSAIIDRLAAPLIRMAVRQAIERPLDVFPIDAARLANIASPKDRALPAITVAVCTLGRSDTLPACLDAIRRLDYGDVELVVVDNSPEPGDVDRVAAERGARYVAERGAGLDRARNRAIDSATHDIIAFTDDDTQVDPGWARAIARRFAESPEVHAVTGLVMPLELETAAQLGFERYLGFGRGFDRRWVQDAEAGSRAIALRHGNTGRLGTGANMAFRRSILSTIGGFDPALDLGTVTNGGGDLDMFFRVIKAGGTLVYEPAAVVRHRHRRDWSQLQDQLHDWGIAMRSYMERNRRTFPEERVPFRALMALLLGTWHLRRLAWSVVDPRLSSRLVLEEISGLLRGGERYDQARQIATDVARRYGVSGPQPRVVSSDTTRVRRAKPQVVDHVVDLAEPIESLSPGDGAEVRLRVEYEGRAIGTVTLAPGDSTVSAARIRDVIAASAAPQIAGALGGVRRADAGERDTASQLMAALQAPAKEPRSRSARVPTRRSRNNAWR